MPAPWHFSRTPWALTGAGLLLAALAWGGATTWRSAQVPTPALVADMEADFCVVAPPTPYDPALGLALTAARAVPVGARCPVCGMYPARSRAWAGQVIFADGDAFFFDSPLSLMMYLGNVGHYTRGRTASAIVARYVTDMDSGAWVDAQQAVYVAGSSALGPMRAGNLPAFADRGAAQRFVQARGGRILGFDAIDAPLLTSLAPQRRSGNGQHAH